VPRRKKDYSDWSKEELTEHIRQLEKRKKYGLVWDEERTKEQFETEAANSLPVLVETPELSIETDPDQPTHILIEGDNYHALSVLNYTHEKSVDFIFIDPPYNIGNRENRDFKYNDSYVDKDDSFRHSKWLSFMEKRLRLAKGLLRDTGLIYITIDDNEFAQLKLLCDDIFGEDNFVTDIVWRSRQSVSNDAIISLNHNHIMFYAKNKQLLQGRKLDYRFQTNMEIFTNPDNDPNGPWTADPFDAPNIRPNLTYPIENPNTGEIFLPPTGRCWRTTEVQYLEYLRAGQIVFGTKGTSKPQLKRYKEFAPDRNVTPTSWFDDVGTTTEGSKELKKIFGSIVFPNPKPTRLIKQLIDLSLRDNGIVLDFFAGSGSTAQAVIEQNFLDGFNRQCILVTNNENNIMTEVCYPRVQRVMQGYEYQGKDKTLLYERKVNLTQLRRANEIYAEYQQSREENSALYDELKGEFKDNTIHLWGITNIKGWKDGLGGNLKYYRTDFVPADPTDANKELLTFRSVEMLCLRENTFDFVTETDAWKIYENQNQYTGILFDQLSIPEFKSALAELDEKPVSVYVFSLGDDNFAPEFANMGERVSVRSIPEAILRVYRRIYQ